MAALTSHEFENIQKEFQSQVEQFSKAQKKNDKLIRLNGQLETQLHENEMVQEELGFCKDDAKIFKLVGDVLIPQSLSEAKSNVGRRIEYIQNESKRNGELITANKAELLKLREAVAQKEQLIQKHQQSTATATC